MDGPCLLNFQSPPRAPCCAPGGGSSFGQGICRFRSPTLRWELRCSFKEQLTEAGVEEPSRVHPRRKRKISVIPEACSTLITIGAANKHSRCNFEGKHPRKDRESSRRPCPPRSLPVLISLLPLLKRVSRVSPFVRCSVSLGSRMISQRVPAGARAGTVPLEAAKLNLGAVAHPCRAVPHPRRAAPVPRISRVADPRSCFHHGQVFPVFSFVKLTRPARVILVLSLRKRFGGASNRAGRESHMHFK